jgi:transcriptional regulator with XRE-family HTH domain
MTTASKVLEAARRRAGLSQSEWARRSGVTQPMINRYLRDQAQPSVGQLERLLEGAGFEAEIALHPIGRRSTRELGDELVQVLYLADALPQHGRDRTLPTPFLELVLRRCEDLRHA